MSSSIQNPSDIYSNWLKKRLELTQISFFLGSDCKFENSTCQLIQIQLKKKSQIQILYLNFKIQLQQKSKFEIYILFKKKLKIDEKICFLRVI